MRDPVTVLAAAPVEAAAFRAGDFSGGIAFAPGSALLTTTPRSEAFRPGFGMLPTEPLRDGIGIIAASIEERLDRTTSPRSLARERAWP